VKYTSVAFLVALKNNRIFFAVAPEILLKNENNISYATVKNYGPI
jgi:hypothetical protein